MIHREASSKILQLSNTFKAVAIIGPRQSGKTTLVKALFPDKPYVSLENADVRHFASEDPRGFLEEYANGAVFDEVQRTPDLLSYLQEIIDNSSKKGHFILTGSNNFLLQQNVSQSLAGRVAYIRLLPFSSSEIFDKDSLPDENKILLKGHYPPIYDQNLPYEDWYPNYIQTYIERDVRQIKNITDLIVFERFVKLLAGRNEQELNLTAIGTEAGIDSKTVRSWIGILESSFIIYLLRPHHKNYNKVIVKRPKLYFYDTGLVCSLLGITEPNQLQYHPLRGSIFESLVVSELVKKRTNKGKPVNLYFWRNKTGYEVDLIIDKGTRLTPVEIKSGKTINRDYFKNILYWLKLSQESKAWILYAGDREEKRSNGIHVMNWFDALNQEEL